MASFKGQKPSLELVGKGQGQNTQLKGALSLLAGVQQSLLEADHPKQAVEKFISELLTLTGSRFGFLAMVAPWSDAKDTLHSLSLLDTSWDSQTRSFFTNQMPNGLTFLGLDHLTKDLISSKDILCHEMPIYEMEGPTTFPNKSLKLFAGLPLWVNGKCVGVLGLAREKTPYSDDLLDLIKTLGPLASGLVKAYGEVSELGSVDLFSNSGEELALGVVDAALDAIIASDYRGRIVMCNPETERLFGFTTEELLGKRVDMLMPTEHASRHSQYITNYTDGGAPQIIGSGREVRAKRKDGSQFSAFLSVSDFKVNGVRHFAASLHDLTERNETLEALEREKERSQQYLEIAATPIIILDKNQKISLVNNSASELFEAKSVSLRGKNCFNNFAAEHDRERALEHFNGVINGTPAGADWIEYEIKTLGGKTRLVNWRFAPIRNSDGEITGAIGSGIDITESRQAEMDLHQAQKMQALGLLTGGIAHDFNNLLAVIKGNVNMLLEDIADMDSGEQSELNLSAEEILAAADRGVSLTSRLLVFSRRKNIKTNVVKPLEMLTDLTTLLKRTLDEKIEFIIEVEPGAEAAMIDISVPQLENAILNLAINARDAMPEGGRLKIQLDQVEFKQNSPNKPSGLMAGKYVMIELADTGEGISPENLERVLDPFFTTKKAGKGSGLGLSMVFGLAEQVGGTMSISSELDVGTNVRLWLPAVDDAALAKAAVVGKVSLKDGDVKSLAHGDESILVVEDEAGVRDTLIRNLSRLGYKITAFDNANSAWEFIDSGGQFDLLLTDLVMPGGMSGQDLVNAFREKNTETPIIMISGYSEELKNFDESATTKVVLMDKPFDMVDLSQKIRDLL